MMKRLLIIILSLAPLLGFAQKRSKKESADNYPPPPRVWVGNEHSYYANRDSILAHPVLNTDSVGCRVSLFTISLQAPGHPFFGPLYSVGWELTQTQKDILKQWDYPDVTMYVQDLHLNCHEKDALGVPFQMLLNHKQ